MALAPHAACGRERFAKSFVAKSQGCLAESCFVVLYGAREVGGPDAERPSCFAFSVTANFVFSINHQPSTINRR
jgi:hypothetical protein